MTIFKVNNFKKRIMKSYQHHKLTKIYLQFNFIEVLF